MVFDILIGGGSFVGSAMALALAKTFGPTFRVALVGSDFEAGRGDDVRASALTAGSKAVFEALGLWSEIEGHAQAVSRIELTDSSLGDGVRPVLTRYDNVLEGDEPASWIVPNRAVADVLARALASRAEVVRLSGAITGWQASPTRATVALADGQSIEARLVIAADGRRSRLREAAGIGVVTFGAGQTGIVTRIAHELPHDGVAVQHFLPGGPFAILPLPGQRSCITWSEDRGEADRILALDDAAFLEEIDMRVAGRLGVLSLDGPRQSWPLSTQLARSYVAARFVLIGDAAHGVHPIAGQGLNLGLKDVAALTEVLADAARVGLDPGDAASLQRYERWRRFDAFASATAFEGLNRLFSNDVTLLRSAREVGLGLVDRIPALKRLLVREAAGLTGEVPLMMKGVLPG
jgi:2-octaprenyl-6-methoxyphenol hydroxylase